MINNNPITVVSIADIHFGALDPKYTYETLRNQFTLPLYSINFDILVICGDLFDAKFMSNNPIISYTLLFIDELVNLCRQKNATFVLLAGTESHDNGQLSLFYHYLQDPTIDMRIVENICFQNIKNLRILCIPEKYGLPEEEYKKVLFESGGYDLCFLHGTLKNSFKGTEIATLASNHAPVFGINSFINCAGPILCGHYHIAGCYEEYMYYNGSALRYKFGEEAPKGFMITLYDPTSRRHYTRLIEIDSYIYKTINIDHLLNEDPKKIIEYIKHEKEVNNIDFIRVQFNNPNENINVVRSYFRNIGNVKLQEMNKKERQSEQIDAAVLERYNEYNYILDSEISDYDKFCMYVNQNEGYDFISSAELIELLEDN